MEKIKHCICLTKRIEKIVSVKIVVNALFSLGKLSTISISFKYLVDTVYAGFCWNWDINWLKHNRFYWNWDINGLKHNGFCWNWDINGLKDNGFCWNWDINGLKDNRFCWNWDINGLKDNGFCWNGDINGLKDNGLKDYGDCWVLNVLGQEMLVNSHL